MENLIKQIREKILDANKTKEFLLVLYQEHLKNHDSEIVLEDILIDLHNKGKIDVIKAFKELKNNSDVSYDFFLTRSILEEIIPKINVPILPLIECVVHLTEEAGNDMAAGTLINPYIEYCIAEPNRSYEAISIIKNASNSLYLLLSPSIIAGSRIDFQNFYDEATQLCTHEDIDIRRSAVYSIGKLDYKKNKKQLKESMSFLKEIGKNEEDEYFTANLIKSTFNLLLQDSSLEHETIIIISSALSSRKPAVLHAASEIVGFNSKDIPEKLIKVLFENLKYVDPKNVSTLKNIDYALVSLIKMNFYDQVIEYMEYVLIINSGNLSINIFNSFIHEIIIKNDSFFKKILTKWFLKGDRPLCEAIVHIINSSNKETLLLEIDILEIKDKDPIKINFIARKSAGYLFFKPITSTSIILSLMNICEEEKTLINLAQLIYEPLLINYTGSVFEYLEKEKEKLRKEVRKQIEFILKRLRDYLDQFNDIKDIVELRPSTSQVKEYSLYFSKEMKKSMDEAEKKSIFLNLFSKQVLLYGRNSVDYIKTEDGSTKRTELPMNSHSVEMEFPRLQNIDPFGLDYFLRILRVEKIIK